MKRTTCTLELLDVVTSGEAALAAELDVINGLNVFPVPDGDTGTNMLATVHEALSQAASADSPAEVAGKLARGALLGARGNSGVILSQLFRALGDTMRDQPVLSGCLLYTLTLPTILRV